MFGLRLAFCLMVWAFGSAVLAQTPQQAERTLRFATEGARPPFNFFDPQSKLTGYEIELAEAVCSHMRVRCVFEAHSWEQLLPGLIRKKYDAVISQIPITPYRLRIVTFSEVYGRPSSVLVTAKTSSFTQPDQLSLESKIGVQQTSAAERSIQALSQTLDVRSYARDYDALLDLSNQALDGVVMDRFEALKWLGAGKEALCCKIAFEWPYDPAILGKGYGIAVRKEDKALRLELDAALMALKQNGVQERLVQKYFPNSHE
jgi:polar amino acid transport system substrate-binding protein